MSSNRCTEFQDLGETTIYGTYMYNCVHVRSAISYPFFQAHTLSAVFKPLGLVNKPVWLYPSDFYLHILHVQKCTYMYIGFFKNDCSCIVSTDFCLHVFSKPYLLLVSTRTYT